MIRVNLEEVKEDTIIQKFLRSLHMRFNSKISSFEKVSDLNNFKMDKFLCTLITYEMRIERENYEPKEEILLASKKDEENNYHQDFSSYESNQELDQLAKKLKCGWGKYKQKFPFKYFDRTRVGHFSSKFPYKEKAEEEDDNKFGNKSQKH